jgi:Holliday junction DNA helicase RuvA
MISYIKGRVLQKGQNFLIIETTGIGYRVFVTPDSLDSKLGDEVELYVHHRSGEDGQALFGLPNFETLEFFELLISVSGIGPKLALTILSAARVDTIRQAIASENPDIFTRVSGVGQKTAERIIVDLKNKVGAQAIALGNSDVYDALIALGYNAKEVRRALLHINPATNSDQQLKEALKLLGK